MKQKRKAAEKIQRLANTNFTTKESRLTFSYEKEGLRADTSLLIVNK